MKISVIIPTLNEEVTITNLVSFIRHYGKNSVTEVIVVDAGSSDKTIEFAKHAGATIIVSKKLSRASQMNVGAKAAMGDVLYFVHADVKLVDSFVNDIFQSIKEGYEAGCYRFKFDSPSIPLRFNAYCTRFKGILCRGGDQTLFITRKLFFNLKGFDEFFTIMEDYDFIDRLRKKNKFKIIPKYVLVSARKYETNSWAKVQRANFTVFMMYFMKRHPDEIKAVYKKMLDYR